MEEDSQRKPNVRPRIEQWRTLCAEARFFELILGCQIVLKLDSMEQVFAHSQHMAYHHDGFCRSVGIRSDRGMLGELWHNLPSTLSVIMFRILV